MRKYLPSIAAAVVLIAAIVALCPTRSNAAVLHYVGCNSEGMFPGPPPPGTPLRVNIKHSLAKQLAVYEAWNNFIIAPRGWNCIGIASSSDFAIYVYAGKTEDSDGGMVIYDQIDGYPDVYEAVGLAIRYFPKLLTIDDFKRWLREPIGSEDDYVEPFHVNDQTKIISVTTLMFMTPGGTNGLGNTGDNWIPKSQLDTSGFIKLFMYPHMVPDVGEYTYFAVRLPGALSDLRPVLMTYMKACLLGVSRTKCPPLTKDYGIK